MSNIIYLEEVRIKKELAKAESALRAARDLRARGIEVPNDILDNFKKIKYVCDPK